MDHPTEQKSDVIGEFLYKQLPTPSEDKQELFIFKAGKAVWKTHPNKSGDANCFGRIVRLYYPWKWDTHYCQRECCKITDPEAIMEAGHYGPDKPEFVRHIAATTTHYDPTDFYWCMDCGRVGIMEEVTS